MTNKRKQNIKWSQQLRPSKFGESILYTNPLTIHIMEESISSSFCLCTRRERKDKQQKGSLVKMGKENKDKTRTTLIQKQERQLLATSSYHIWKSTKDKKIHETKTLFTYKLDPRQPPKDNKWRPARSIKYSYPTDPKTESRRSGSNVTSSGLVKPVDSYSSHSFESDAESQPTSPSSSHEDNLKKTGQLKTVTLCCQTLEYWCTCEDNKKNEE